MQAKIEVLEANKNVDINKIKYKANGDIERYKVHLIIK